MIPLRRVGTHDAITEQTGLSRTEVFDIRKRHADGGAKALRDAIGGRKVGEGRVLTADQEREARQMTGTRQPTRSSCRARSGLGLLLLN